MAMAATPPPKMIIFGGAMAYDDWTLDAPALDRQAGRLLRCCLRRVLWVTITAPEVPRTNGPRPALDLDVPCGSWPAWWSLNATSAT